MTIETETSMEVLTAMLNAIDRALSRLMAKRFRVLARMDQLVNSDGTNGRLSSAAVAAASKCSASQAEGELALARKLATLPAVSDAFANGDVSAGQIGAVAQIASPGDEERALELARTASSAVLEREAAARRKDLLEQRLAAQDGRFLTFKPTADNQSITIFGRGPWAEMHELQQRLEKIAAQIGRGVGAVKLSHSTRMFDAMMTLVRANLSTRINHADPSTEAEKPAASTTTPRPVTPRLNTRGASQRRRPGGSVGLLDRSEPGGSADTDSTEETARGGATLFGGFDCSESPNNSDLDDHAVADDSDEFDQFHAFDDAGDSNDTDDTDDTDDAGDTDDETVDQRNFDDPDEPFPANPGAQTVVTRADTKVVIHYDARTGIVAYQNGPPIDHERFMAIMTEASIEVIHYDNGSPNGIVTTQRTKTDRQARYLAHRDGCCRVPECPGIGNTHAHHTTPASVVPGRTETGGLINLCNFHHGEHHDGKLNITGNPEATVTFKWTDGRTVSSTARKN